MAYSAAIGDYTYQVRGSPDLFERAPKGGSTYVIFDGDSGALLLLSQPTGERTGNTIESWLYALHMSRIFGRAYQILTCLLGLVVATLSVTGVYIWLRKRRVRLRAAIPRLPRSEDLSVGDVARQGGSLRP